MSNYQARQRAIRAERAALRCEQLVEETREQCRRRERQIWGEAEDRFDLEHQSVMRQMDFLQQAIIDVQKAAPSVFYVGESK